MSITKWKASWLFGPLLCCAAACSTQFKSADAGTAANGQSAAPVGSGGGGAIKPAGSGGMSGMAGMTGMAGMSGMTATGAGTGGKPATATGTGGAVAMPTDAGTTPEVDAGKPVEVVTCPATALAPGDSNGSVMVGETMREYILHVPANYTGQTPVPLVTDWHPILTDNVFEKGNSGYEAKGDAEGFIVAWPNGIDNAWNVGPCCTTQRSVDDVGFARAMIAKIRETACIDPKRIYAVGYSMGGGMSYKLACDAADIIAAVAPAAFELMEDNEWPCNPVRPITVISSNGTADFIVPYGGGASTPPNGLNVTNHFLGAQGTFTKWSMLDGCTGTPEDKGNGCSTYTQCKDGVEVTLCVTQGGGHVSGDPDIGWDMLKKHPLP